MLLSIRRLSELFCASDLKLTRRVRRYSDQRLTLAFFALVSRLGDGIVWYLLMLLLLLFGGETGQRATLQMALLGILSLLVYKALKRLSKRPRPLAVDHALGTRVAPLDEFSFPSGHTLHAVGFTLVVTQHFPESGLLLWPLCACIAMSRVVLGLHYPSDVLAAIGLGWVLGEGSARLML
ncbi:MAG: phosphatase PAP2 family protein [Rhodanobacteraceae bacterium]|nr:phosphatase PAP2 family protein [Rhodanobacteraceae bacterium]